MGFILHCVPGNHSFDESDEGKRFVVMADPRYAEYQAMNVYACSKHQRILAVHCGDWFEHESHSACPGTIEGLYQRRGVR